MMQVGLAFAEANQSTTGKMYRKQFNNSICFIKCHQPNSFSPSDKSKQQWEFLIEKNGHAIFEDIPWENEQQKKQIIDYLLRNSKGFLKEGIGVWE
jgi:hypothetical protein